MTDPGAIFPMECRVCHRLVRPGRPGWARIMIVCAECLPRRGQLAKERRVVPDLIDMAVRCTRCSEMGATVSGLCLDCVAREIADELSRILDGTR